jgi:esterase
MQTVSLNFKEYGSGNKNLIIIHGFLGSLDNWHTLATHWATLGLHIFSLDMRNHGKSPHTPSHSIAHMAADVLAFLKQMNIQQTMVLGHSMGGKVAMYLALNSPHQISKLIVADIAPKKYNSGAHDHVFEAIKKVNLAKINSRKEADDEMKPFLGDFSTRQFVLKSLERVGDHFEWRFNIDVLIASYNQVIEEIYTTSQYFAPTCFIRGALSLYIKPDDESHIKQLFPNSTIYTINDAGHWLHAEKPIEFSNTLIDFVNNA